MQVVLVDPTVEGFDSEWIPCKEFHTLHEVPATTTEASELPGDVLGVR